MRYRETTMIQCTGLFGLLVLGTLGAAFLKGDFDQQPDNTVAGRNALTAKAKVASNELLELKDLEQELGPALALFEDDGSKGKIFVRRMETLLPKEPATPMLHKGSAGIAGS